MKKKVLFIDLLCQFKPHSVKRQLKRANYPIDQCLEVCKLHKNLDGVTYLQESTGLNKEAVQSYVKELIKGLNDIRLKIEKQDPTGNHKLHHSQNILSQIFPFLSHLNNNKHLITYSKKQHLMKW